MVNFCAPPVVINDTGLYRNFRSPPSPNTEPSLTCLPEVDRAVDNLNKSGKLFTPPVSRRDSLPTMGGARTFSDFGRKTTSIQTYCTISDKHLPDPRMGGIPQRHSISDYEQLRPQSGSNLQSFYANQRHQPRPNEAEQMLQAKRRMAAQRERELRNYHQEQQYNRSMFPCSMTGVPF